jgi:hypothetical protein
LALAGLVAVAALSLAGCVTPADEGVGTASDDGVPDETPVPTAPDVAWGEIVVNDHTHDRRELHTDKGGFALAGHAPLTEGLEPWATYSGYSEPRIHGDLAVVSSIEGNRAFTIVDVSDPADPDVVSHFYSWGENWDARWSEDGDYIFAGCQGGTPGGAYTQAAGVGACVAPDGVPQEGTANAILAVDVSDPANPELVATVESAPIHNLDTATLDDGTILVANNGGELFTFDPSAGSFETVGSFEARHDVEFATHPKTGQELLFTGAKDLTIYDVSTPSNPTVVGAVDPQELPDGVTAWHEQSPAPAMVDGRWVLVGAGEQSGGLPGPVGVFDITDPSNITLVGTWKLPGGPYTEQGSYKFSNHNVHVSETGQVALSMYHAGVWAFDVSTEERMEEPETLAAYQPHKPRLAPPMITPYGSFNNVPYVWGAQWHSSGHLVVPDMNTGLYVLEPTFGNASMVRGPVTN